MTVNRTEPGYAPNTNEVFFVPVQQGSVTNLGVSVTPAGKAILWWTDITASQLRCAVLPSILYCFGNDLVAPGDVRTAWSGGGTRQVHAGAMAVIGGALYAFVSHYQDNASGLNGKVQCYVANSVENPTSWSLHATIQDLSLTIGQGTISFENQTMGPPTVLTSGRWVLPANTWRSYTGTLTDGVGLFTSDNGGASWATRIDFRNPAGLGGNSGTITTAVARDPATGGLVYARSASAGFSSDPVVYTSADNGTTWTTHTTVGGGKGIPHFYVDDTATLYACNDRGTERRIMLVPDPTSAASWVDTGLVGIECGAYGELDGFQALPLFSQGADLVAFTARDRLAGLRGGWLVGEVGFA